MKIKNWLLIIFAFIMTFIMTSCAPVVASLNNNFVPLPDAEKTGITAIVVTLLALVLGWIGTKLPWTLPLITRFKEEITVSLSALIIGLVQNALPGAYPEISILVVQLVIAAFGAIGIFKVIAKLGAKKPEQLVGG